jgi:hypothetical protein
MPMQVDRSAPWGRAPEAPAAGSHFPGQIPGLPGQMAQGIGGIQAGQAPVSLLAFWEQQSGTTITFICFLPE